MQSFCTFSKPNNWHVAPSRTVASKNGREKKKSWRSFWLRLQIAAVAMPLGRHRQCYLRIVLQNNGALHARPVLGTDMQAMAARTIDADGSALPGNSSISANVWLDGTVKICAYFNHILTPYFNPKWRKSKCLRLKYAEIVRILKFRLYSMLAYFNLRHLLFLHLGLKYGVKIWLKYAHIFTLRSASYLLCARYLLASSNKV